MKNISQVLWGLLIAVVSVGLLFGGLSLSLAESHSPAPVATTKAPTLTSTLTASIAVTAPPKASATPTTTPTLSLPSPTFTLTLATPATTCPPPTGWTTYTVKSGDTLILLAARYHISLTELKQSNCLTVSVITPGMIIYVPPAATQTRAPCGPPSGWVIAYVQPGDTLFKLSQAYGITIAQLQKANCMGSSTLLRVGQALYVPPWAPILPSPTIPVGTFVPTDTIPSIPTDTPPAFFTGTSIIPTP